MSTPPKPRATRPGFVPAAKAARPPTTRPIAESLRADGGLGGLLARVRESEARLQDIRGIVPAALHARLRAGPLDADGWTLLVENAAIAAKMRHVLPLVTETLRDHGWDDRPVRVRVIAAG